MYELTEGDKRYIAESTFGWKMLIAPIQAAIGEMPHEVEERIDALADGYVRDFREFFLAEMNKDGDQLSGPVQRKFEEGWKETHPEFFDMDKLFAGCSGEALKNAESAMLEARRVLEEG